MTDLVYKYPTNKTDYAWFHAQLRLIAKKMYRLDPGATYMFLMAMKTKVFSLEEHALTGNGPVRCEICAVPLDIRTRNEIKNSSRPIEANACKECNRIIDRVFDDILKPAKLRLSKETP